MLDLLTHHDEDIPCFECTVITEGEQIRRFVKHLPEFAWAMARDSVVRPAMERVVEESRGTLALNPAWMDVLPTELDIPPQTVDAERLYYEACELLLAREKKPDTRRFLFLLETIVTVFLKDLVSDDVITGLVAQLHEITAKKNKMFEVVMEWVEFPDVCGLMPSQPDLGHFLRVAGAEDYGRELLRGLHVDIQRSLLKHSARTRKRTRDMERVEARLVRLQEQVKAQGNMQRRLAMAMALVPRLGAGSMLCGLEPGILAMCVGFSEPKRIVRWADFLEVVPVDDDA